MHDDCNSALSVAVQVTMVARPLMNVLPDAGEHETDLIPDRSVAVAAYVTLANGLPGAGEVLMLDGHVMTGLTVSVTWTLKLHDDLSVNWF
jgi:hypothetical protein